MNSVQIFQNNQFGQIRVAVIDENPYFVGRDVAISLGYAKPENAIAQHVDPEDTLKQGIPDKQGFTQITTLVNESGVYSLIFGSKLPAAKAYKKWVTSEVLPAIRKTGGYIHTAAGDSDADIMAKALIVAQKTIENHKQRVQMLEGEKSMLEQENRQLAPKAEYTDKVLQSVNTYTMTQVAKEFGMSAHAFGDKLRQKGVMFYQSGQWMLTSKHQDKSYTKPRTHYFSRSDGSTGTNTITVWTETGRAFLHKIFDPKAD